MDLIIDPDVKAVAEFMQRNIAAARLIQVAEGVRSLAWILWNKYEQDDISTLRLQEPPPIQTIVLEKD